MGSKGLSFLWPNEVIGNDTYLMRVFKAYICPTHTFPQLVWQGIAPQLGNDHLINHER